MRIVLTAVWTGAWCGAAVSLDAQTVEPFVFTSFGMDEGISQGTVEALIQDETGFLWVGTHDGLNRFDGQRFESFRHVRGDSMSLSDDFIRALTQSDDGLIWVGTDRGGLNRFDPQTGEATRYPLEELGPWRRASASEAGPSVAGRTVSALAMLGSGELLLVTDAGGALFDLRTSRASSVSVAAASDLTDVCESSDAAYAADLNGWLWRVRSRNDWDRIARLDTPARRLRCAPRELLVADSEGVIHSVDRETGEVRRLGAGHGDGSEPVPVEDVIRLPSGSLWVATPVGAYIRAPDGSSDRAPTPDMPRGLPHVYVKRLLLDRDGVLWIGTWNGLASLNPLSSKMTRVLHRPEDPDGLLGAGVISIVGGPAGALWLGTTGGGIERLRLQEGGARIDMEARRDFSELRPSSVMSLEWDGDEELWIAAHRFGAFRWREGRVEAIPVMEDGRAVPSTALSVLVDHEGRIWVGTQDHGLTRYDERTGHLVPLQGAGFNLGSRYVWPIIEAADGRLWVGAYNGGVSEVDAEVGVLRRYSAGPDGLSDTRILTLFQGSRGFIWVGTEGGGLNRIDPRTDEVRLYTTDDGLPHDHVEGIVEDDSGSLWITTNNGLARLDVVRGRFEIFREAVGLAGDRFFANGVHKGPDGRLFLGGEKGLTIFHPDSVHESRGAPTVVLTGFRIRGAEASLSRALSANGLDLKPHENFLTFEFTALDLNDPGPKRYRYRLDPLDDDWVDAGTTPVANYTSVPPNEYSFRATARNSEGVWTDDEISIPVRVQAPFYVTWWFRSAVGVLILSIIAALYRYRLSELKRRQELRLAIAGRLHDDIGANLSSIAMKADLIARGSDIGEEKRAWVEELGSAARESADRVRETVWVVNARYDDLPQLAQKMRDLADSVLVGHVSFGFHATPDPLPDRKVPWEVRQNLYLLFKEALTNVVKHAQAGRVEIDVTFDGRVLSLSVRDDGIGFDPDSVREGNGLELMRRRMQPRRFHLALDSGPGRGTVVDFGARL